MEVTQKASNVTTKERKQAKKPVNKIEGYDESSESSQETKKDSSKKLEIFYQRGQTMGQGEMVVQQIPDQDYLDSLSDDKNILSQKKHRQRMAASSSSDSLAYEEEQLDIGQDSFDHYLGTSLEHDNNKLGPDANSSQITNKSKQNGPQVQQFSKGTPSQMGESSQLRAFETTTFSAKLLSEKKLPEIMESSEGILKEMPTEEDIPSPATQMYRAIGTLRKNATNKHRLSNILEEPEYDQDQVRPKQFEPIPEEKQAESEIKIAGQQQSAENKGGLRLKVKRDTLRPDPKVVSRDTFSRLITFKAPKGSEGDTFARMESIKQVKIAPLPDKKQETSPTSPKMLFTKLYTEDNQNSERKNLLTQGNQENDNASSSNTPQGTVKAPGLLRMLTSAFGGNGNSINPDKISARLSDKGPSAQDVDKDQPKEDTSTAVPSKTGGTSAREAKLDLTQDDDMLENDFIKMTELDTKLLGRKSRGRLAKKYIIYPDDQFRTVWEFITTMYILLTCLLTPYYLAFPDQYTLGLTYYDMSTNLVFLIDIIINFFTAYYDQDFQIIDNRRMIARNYCRTWFFIDMLSVIPFDLIYVFGNINKISRFTRIGKIYKLVRLMKIVRLIKIVKVNNKLTRNLSEILKISAGTERLVYLVISFFALQHVTSCLWIFIAQIDDQSKDNWIYAKGYIDSPAYELYITSFYFTVTTLVTVGYGDITAVSPQEKIMCIVMMILGVLTFSFVTGSLSSIITSYDSKEAQLKEKIATLNDISNEYRLDIDLFNKLAKTVKYDHSKKQKDTLQFMEELPHKLKLELAMVIHRSMYSTVTFFMDKDKGFIAWVAKLVRPVNFEDQDYIYKEGEEIVEIFFLVKGSTGYVLPRFENKIYIEFKQGEHFGHSDLGYEREFVEPNRNARRFAIFDKAAMVRRFTVQAFENCEVLAMTVKDLLKMKLEFPKIFAELFKNVRKRLHKELALKIEVIKAHEQSKMAKPGYKHSLRSKLKINILQGLALRIANTPVEDDEEQPGTPKPLIKTIEQAILQKTQKEQAELARMSSAYQSLYSPNSRQSYTPPHRALPHQRTMGAMRINHSPSLQPAIPRKGSFTYGNTNPLFHSSGPGELPKGSGPSSPFVHRLDQKRVVTMAIPDLRRPSILSASHQYQNQQPHSPLSPVPQATTTNNNNNPRTRVTLRMTDDIEAQNDSKLSSVVFSQCESSSNSRQEVEIDKELPDDEQLLEETKNSPKKLKPALKGRMSTPNMWVNRKSIMKRPIRKHSDFTDNEHEKGALLDYTQEDYTDDEMMGQRYIEDCCGTWEIKQMMSMMMSKMDKIEQRIRRVERTGAKRRR